jgi:crossover junction endodeoxyribonuclease RusA
VIRYELPYPPSTNNLFVNHARGRAVSARYKAWRNEAGLFIVAQGRKQIKGPVSLSIGLVRPDRRKRDASNAIKPIEDLLVAMRVIEDDSLVQRISVAWAASGAPCTVIVKAAEEDLAA